MRTRLSGCRSVGRRQRVLRHALRDVVAGQRAVGADVVGLVLGHRLEHRLADLHRDRVGRRLHAVGAGVARAALDRVELHRDRLADQLEHLLGLAADLLHPAVAGDVVADLAQRSLEVGLQQAVLVARHQVLEGVEHRLLHQLDVGVVGEQQRQLLLEHQRAGRDRRQDRIALARVLRQHRNVGLLVLRHAFEVAELELGHAAAALLLDHGVGDGVVREQLDQVVPDAGLVVVDVAGREDRDLAGRALAVHDRRGGGLRGALQRKRRRRELGQPGVGVHVQARCPAACAPAWSCSAR